MSKSSKKRSPSDTKYDELKHFVETELKQFTEEWRLNNNKQKEASGFESAVQRLEDRLKKAIDKVEMKLKVLEETMEDQVDKMEQYSRRNCLLLHGVPEAANEDTDELILQQAQKMLGSSGISITDIDRSHRLGPRRTTATALKQGPRPIIVRFTNYRARQKIFSNKKSLKGSKQIITESLTKRRMNWFRRVRDILGSTKVWTVDGRIMFIMGDKICKIENADDMARFEKSCESLVKDV